MDWMSLRTRITDLREWVSAGPGKWAAILLAVVIVVLAVMVWGSRDDGGNAVREGIKARGWDVTYLCNNCKKSGQTHIAYEAPAPFTCPECKSKSAVYAFRCGGCKNVIENRKDPSFKCPHCGKVFRNTAE